MNVRKSVGTPGRAVRLDDAVTCHSLKQPAIMRGLSMVSVAAHFDTTPANVRNPY